MAKHETLSSLFTAIANAIRSKTGSTAEIIADDFPDVISDISTGGGELQEKTVTPTDTVQEITPDEGYYGLSKVTVEAAEGTVLPDNVGIYYIGRANSVLNADNFDFVTTAVGTLN